jgi:hypothetical protein
MARKPYYNPERVEYFAGDFGPSPTFANPGKFYVIALSNGRNKHTHRLE